MGRINPLSPKNHPRATGCSPHRHHYAVCVSAALPERTGVDNAFLDHRGKNPQGWGYAVFGKVTKGMDVVKKIEAVQISNAGMHQNVPVKDVVITKMEVIKSAASDKAGAVKK